MQRKLTVNYNRTIAIAQYPVIYFVAVTTMSIDAVVVISISIVAALSDRNEVTVLADYLKHFMSDRCVQNVSSLVTTCLGSNCANGWQVC